MTAPDPRMSTARNGSIQEAFAAAFGQGSGPQGAPSVFALDGPGTQEQPAQQSAPQPSVAAISAQTARLLQLQPDQLAQEIEKLAGMAMAESRARHKAEAALAAMRNTPAQQLAAFRRGSL